MNSHNNESEDEFDYWRKVERRKLINQARVDFFMRIENKTERNFYDFRRIFCEKFCVFFFHFHVVIDEFYCFSSLFFDFFLHGHLLKMKKKIQLIHKQHSNTIEYWDYNVHLRFAFCQMWIKTLGEIVIKVLYCHMNKTK